MQRQDAVSQQASATHSPAECTALVPMLQDPYVATHSPADTEHRQWSLQVLSQAPRSQVLGLEVPSEPPWA